MNFIDNEITREPEAKEQQTKEQQPKEQLRQHQKKSKEPIFDIKKRTMTLFDEEDYQIFFKP